MADISSLQSVQSNHEKYKDLFKNSGKNDTISTGQSEVQYVKLCGRSCRQDAYNECAERRRNAFIGRMHRSKHQRKRCEGSS